MVIFPCRHHVRKFQLFKVSYLLKTYSEELILNIIAVYYRVTELTSFTKKLTLNESKREGMVANSDYERGDH